MAKLGRKPLGVRHVFKIKDEPEGERFKERIVVKGYLAIPGIDYTEKFSPVMTDATVKIIISLYLWHLTNYPEEDWVLVLIDYESAFLNADVEKDIYIEYPKGMVELGYMTQEEVD